LLGPLAVDPRRANQGIGVRLITEALSAAKADGLALVILVGDMSYYARFGFKPVPEDQMSLPGPYDPARLLACELIDGATAAYRGPVRA
jgi:predicted N-acetyltransferase YhbS